MIIEQYIKDELGITGLIEFSEFVTLLEGLGPKKTSYGVNYPDLDDGKFNESLSQDTTYIQNDKYIYLISFEGYKDYPDVSFSTIVKSDIDNMDDLKSGEYVLGKKALHSDTLYTFNYVLYVALEYVKKSNPRGFTLSPASSKLDSMYNRLIKNKTFISSLKSVGYELDSVDEYYHFKRIDI